MRLLSRTLPLALLLSLCLGVGPVSNPFEPSVPHVHPVHQIRMDLRVKAMNESVEAVIERSRTARVKATNAARLQAKADVVIAEQIRQREHEAEVQRQLEEERRAQELSAAAAEQDDETPEVTPDPAPSSASGVPWDAIAQCESGGNWSINTGNGYKGGLQWSQSTWNAVKLPHHPDDPVVASREQEIEAAENLLRQPWGGLHHWPACSRKLGLR